MIPVKVLASILLFLTFIHAFPFTLERVDDASIQRSNLVVRQTTPPVSVAAVAATGSESLNLTDFVDTFEGLAIDLKGVGGVLRNLTETLKEDVSDVSENVLLFVHVELERFTQILTEVLQKIEDKSFGDLLPNGPLKELFNGIPESLKNLVESLDNLRDALIEFSPGNLNSLRNIFKALKGAVNALIEAVGAIIKLLVAVEILDKVPVGDLNKVLNDLAGLTNDLAGLKGILGILGGLLGLSL